MAKQQTFADKAGKLGKKAETVIDPESGKEGTWKFLESMQKVYESSLKPYKP